MIIVNGSSVSAEYYLKLKNDPSIKLVQIDPSNYRTESVPVKPETKVVATPKAEGTEATKVVTPVPKKQKPFVPDSAPVLTVNPKE